MNKCFVLPANLDIREIELNYEAYRSRLESIGKPWAWERRPKYRDKDSTLDRLNDQRSKLFSLHLDGKEIGYCLSIPRDDLSAAFAMKAFEIENFAIDVKFNGKGYGSPFFRYVCNNIFSNGAELVYLSTRSTNHPKVIPFYQGHGMSILKQEIFNNDLS